MEKEYNTDNLLLDMYNLGWDECFSGDNTNGLVFEKNSIFRVAYEMGWSDYIAGDDVSSFDEQTNEEIINKIKECFKTLNQTTQEEK